MITNVLDIGVKALVSKMRIVSAMEDKMKERHLVGVRTEVQELSDLLEKEWQHQKRVSPTNITNLRDIENLRYQVSKVAKVVGEACWSTRMSGIMPAVKATR